MSQHERCKRCPDVPMVARTNGHGLVYLECPDCGAGEAVERRVDPLPTIWRTYSKGKHACRRPVGDLLRQRQDARRTA